MVRGSTIDVSKVNKVVYDIDLSIHNKFDVEIVDSSTGEVKQKAEAYNIIKNTLWSRLCGEVYWPDWFKVIQFGEGTGTPTADSIGLFQQVGSKSIDINTMVVEAFPKDGYAYCRKSIRLEPTEYIGYNLTEVGIGYSGAKEALCTHAMLQDMNGNPISITKTDTDIINIYATVYVHWNPEGYEDGKIKLCYMPSLISSDGGIISELLGCIRVYDNINWYLSYYGGPVTNSLPAHTVNTSTSKSVNDRTYTITVSRLNVDYGNISTGIRTAYHRGIMITSPSLGLPGTTINAEAIGTGDGVTTEFNTNFPTPQNAEIYVDGELVTDVVVDNNPGTRWPASCYFEFLPEHSNGFCGFPLAPTPVTKGGCDASGYRPVFYNPWYQFGISQITFGHTWGGGYVIEASNDLITWHPIERKGGALYHTYPIPEELAYYKYWVLTCGYIPAVSTDQIIPNITPVIPFSNNIRFATPPAEGAVITANYYTPVVAKDVNHVFDMSIVIHLGEYQE